MDIVKAFFSAPFFEWWSFENGTYTGILESLKYIEQYSKEHGPFEGVLGFSQGACLAAILCATHSRYPELSPLPGLRFGVLFSGFAPVDASYSELFLEKIQFPVYVSFGRTDFKKDDSIQLADHFLDAVVIEHASDHQLPRKSTGAQAISSLHDFLGKQKQQE